MLFGLTVERAVLMHVEWEFLIGTSTVDNPI